MSISFDYDNFLINITEPQNTLACQELINAIRLEEASLNGILYPQIATASGKEELGSGVNIGITVSLNEPWQVKFWSGNYIAKVSGGNLVGGLNNDPVAYSSGVQVLLIQSAASTVVQSDGSSIDVDVISNKVSTEVWSRSSNNIIIGSFGEKLSNTLTSQDIQDLYNAIKLIKNTVV